MFLPSYLPSHLPAVRTVPPTFACALLTRQGEDTVHMPAAHRSRAERPCSDERLTPSPRHSGERWQLLHLTCQTWSHRGESEGNCATASRAMSAWLATRGAHEASSKLQRRERRVPPNRWRRRKITAFRHGHDSWMMCDSLLRCPQANGRLHVIDERTCHGTCGWLTCYSIENQFPNVHSWNIKPKNKVNGLSTVLNDSILHDLVLEGFLMLNMRRKKFCPACSMHDIKTELFDFMN